MTSPREPYGKDYDETDDAPPRRYDKDYDETDDVPA